MTVGDGGSGVLVRLRNVNGGILGTARFSELPCIGQTVTLPLLEGFLAFEVVEIGGSTVQRGTLFEAEEPWAACQLLEQ